MVSTPARGEELGLASTSISTGPLPWPSEAEITRIHGVWLWASHLQPDDEVSRLITYPSAPPLPTCAEGGLSADWHPAPLGSACCTRTKSVAPTRIFAVRETDPWYARARSRKLPAPTVLWPLTIWSHGASDTAVHAQLAATCTVFSTPAALTVAPPGARTGAQTEPSCVTSKDWSLISTLPWRGRSSGLE